MTAIPPPIHTIANLIDEHHASQPDEPRLHLGGSMLGHPCERWLWLSFRWAVRERFPGRIRRLFRRGNNEEDIITDDLKAIGIDINSTGDQQRFIKLGRTLADRLTASLSPAFPVLRKPAILRSTKPTPKSLLKIWKRRVCKHPSQCTGRRCRSICLALKSNVRCTLPSAKTMTAFIPSE